MKPSLICLVSCLLLWAGNAYTDDGAQRVALVQDLSDRYPLPALEHNDLLRQALVDGDLDTVVTQVGRQQDDIVRFDAANAAIYLLLPGEVRRAVGEFPGDFCGQVARRQLANLHNRTLDVLERNNLSLPVDLYQAVRKLGETYPAFDEKSTLQRAIDRCVAASSRA